MTLQKPTLRETPTRLASSLIGLVALCTLVACGGAQNRGAEAPKAATQGPSLAQQVDSLGESLSFFNSEVPDGAEAPEVGADYVYARTHSANSRNSPVGIAIWVFREDGGPLHFQHKSYVTDVYKDIYGWSPSEWKQTLGDAPDAAAVLREKSDFFWESLAQHLAERILGEAVTPAMYRWGPACAQELTESCQHPGIEEATRVVVRTFLNARRDPMNPVTRSITYDVRKGQLSDPELIFELQVPNGLTVAGPHQETLDFRPKIGGEQDAVGDIRVWAHLPRGRRARTKNTDYPDYNLVFVPLRHLVVQREVEDPKRPASGADYPDVNALIAETRTLISRLRTPEQGRQVADALKPFLTAKYYYMFESGGQGLVSYRDYILGAAAGVGRGLNPDFGRIEITLDGVRSASFLESDQP